MNISSKSPTSELTVHSHSGIPSDEEILSFFSRGRSATLWDGQPLGVTIYHSWQELKETLVEWEDILSTNPLLSIFSTPEWICSWWKTFGSSCRMQTVAFTNTRHQLVGLAPLYLAHVGSKPFGKLRWLRLIGDGSGDSDNMDLITRPGFEEPCAVAFLKWLASQSGWDLCCLNMLPEHSKIARALSHQLGAARWPLTVEHAPNAAIDLPSSWDSFVESLSGDFRPLVTRYPKRLANRYRVRIHRCERAEELDRSLEILFSLHQKRWNQASEPGSFGCTQRRDFYRLISESFLRRRWLELWFLELDGIDVAAQFCFSYRNTAYILQEGFDPNFSRDKVGYVLRGAIIRYLIDLGVKRYDFLGGFSSHKQRWGAQAGSYLSLTFAPPNTIGSYSIHCNRIARTSKEWLRQHLPSHAWTMLHWAKSKVAPSGARS